MCTKAPGRYQARVTASGLSEVAELEIIIDPRLKGVTHADLEEQFQLASKIRDKTSAANDAVIEIRSVRDQLEERLEASANPPLQTAGRDLIDKLSEIEHELYQVKNQPRQDPLNFPIRLNRLASLRRSVENGDAKPTDGAYKVFEELSAELDEHLSQLESLMNNDLPALNQRLQTDDADGVDRDGSR